MNSNLFDEDDLNDDQMNYLRLMCESGVSDQTVANIMTNVMNKAGKQGEFLSSTIRNINKKCQDAMDEIAGLSSADMTIAQRTIDRLNA